jgi:hypothetical protein
MFLGGFSLIPIIIKIAFNLKHQFNLLNKIESHSIFHFALNSLINSFVVLGEQIMDYVNLSQMKVSLTCFKIF